jgi:hypothetical protein
MKIQMHSSGYFSFSLHRQLNDAMPENGDV